MNAKEYIGDLTGGALLVTESRIVAESLLQHLPDKEWRELIIEQNILQKRSPNTAIRYARAVRKRLQPLGEDFLQAVIDATEREYLQLLMTALLIQAPIVTDFMRQVVAENRRLYKPDIPVNAWDLFMDDRIRALPDLANLSDSTLKKTGTNTIRSLVESGYLSSNKERKLQPVYLLPETHNWLEKLGRKDLVEVMECTL